MIVILTEEPSMRAALETLFAKHWPERARGVDWLVISHEGKADLERKMEEKMRCWNAGEPYFIVLRDNDGGDCLVLNARLRAKAIASGKSHQIRIVCQELESWLLVDPEAVRAAYPRCRFPEDVAKYREPDRLGNASQILGELTGDRAKVPRARLIVMHWNPTKNRSRSFQAFFAALAGRWK